jgi:hypothetical protein
MGRDHLKPPWPVRPIPLMLAVGGSRQRQLAGFEGGFCRGSGVANAQACRLCRAYQE